MTPTPYTTADFDRSPLMFYYEVTQACDLVCRHCRASAQKAAHPDQLSTEQSKALIDQIAGFERKPIIVMTGGDPLKRPDIFELISYAKGNGFDVALTPSATPLATRDALRKAKRAGVRRLGISLDGPDAETHDAFRGWSGSFERTLHMLEDARNIGLSVQINTSITARNFHTLDALAELLARQDIAMWSVFFLVPVGRGQELERITPAEYEIAFEKLWHYAQTMPYAVKTTEAPHYRRYVLQQSGDPLAGPGGRTDKDRDAGHRAPLGVRDGKGIMFVGYNGEIYPAGFLPVSCGRFPNDSVTDVYRIHPTFRALRDPDQFNGKCSYCEFRHLCGGSRSRAYAVTGDMLAAEPDCTYQPVSTVSGLDAAQPTAVIEA
jgi:AdoMet-dependent heme synthase